MVISLECCCCSSSLASDLSSCTWADSDNNPYLVPGLFRFSLAVLDSCGLT